jgi:hypothetical protein
MSTSIPPEESTSHVHDSPVGATHTVLSVLEQATSREGRPDSTPVSTVIGTAHNMLHRLTSSSSSTPHAHDTPSPEALLDSATTSATPTVLGAAQNMISRLTSSSTHHATPHATPALPPQTQKPVPDVPPQEQPAEVSSPTEGPQQRGAEPTGQGQPTTRSISSHGGGRANTPPRGTARVTRSYPALPEATHPPRPIRVSHIHRRPTGPYADSETAWHPWDDRDPVRSFSDDHFSLPWAADCSAWGAFSVPRKNCWSAHRSNRHRGENRAFQGQKER